MPQEDKVTIAASILRAGDEAAADWAITSRAVASLEAALRRAFPARGFAPDYPPPSNWTGRASASRGRELVALLASVPVKQRGRILYRILWPSHQDIEHSDLAAGGTGKHLVWARLRRWGRGLRRKTWNAPPS